jgi:hypothetical protein
MAKLQSQIDLERGIVASLPAAERALEAARLFVKVLLRLDSRVQAAYRSWWARMVDAEAAGIFTEAAVRRSLQDDAAQLFTLTRSLGLERYRWLPMMLRWEFQRQVEENACGAAVDLKMTLPPDLAWATPGKRPKRGPSRGSRRKNPEGSRLENLPRTIEWFYLCEVRQPRIPKNQLAVERRVSLKDVQHACRRARTLLNCIDPPFPNVGDA